MNIYLQEKTYSKEEICKLLGVKLPNPKMKRTIVAKLSNLGYQPQHYTYGHGGTVTILHTPSTTEEKVIYLTCLLGIDV